MKNLLQKTGLFLALILWVGNISAQSYQCNGTNLLSGINVQMGNPYYAITDSWTPSTNYNASWSNGSLTLRLGDATIALWQAQFPVTCASQILTAGKTYFLSFDIQTNVALPRAYMKLQAAADNDHFVDLPAASVPAGKTTVSGITVNTTTAFDEILFDFGGNPSDANITVSNITLCDNYSSGDTGAVPANPCNHNLADTISFTAGTPYFAPNWVADPNYTTTWENGVFTVGLNDATNASWQAQFPLDCNTQSVVNGKTYFLSFDVESNIDLPRAYMKLDVKNKGDNFMDLPAVTLSAGQKITVSGFSVSTTDAFNEILFDFGNNPAGAVITISNIVICDDYPTYPVTLKVIDQSKGVITNNVNDNNETNIFCWIDNNLSTLNLRNPSDWWYPMYNDTGVTPTGELIKGANDWTWQITLNAAPGTYKWNPYAKTLGWSSINPNMYAYTGDDGNNFIFTVSKAGDISGHSELLIKDNTGIKNPVLDNVVVVGGQSSITATFEGTANVSIYSIQGKLIKEAIAQNTFKADNLPVGIYVVKIGSKAYKAVVK